MIFNIIKIYHRILLVYEVTEAVSAEKQPISSSSLANKRLETISCTVKTGRIYAITNVPDSRERPALNNTINIKNYGKKIERLKDLNGDLEMLIYILEGNFSREQLNKHEKDLTINSQVACYNSLGTDIQITIEEIISEHGSEDCPSED